MRFTSVISNRTISKKFSLDDGELVKSDGGILNDAMFATASSYKVDDLYKLIDECNDRNILIQGTSEFECGNIYTKYELKRRELETVNLHKVTRTKNDFKYRGGEGFLLLDYDPSPDYELNDGEPLSMDDLLSLLYEYLPEIKTAPHLWKTSSSSCIYNESGDELKGIGGQHIFVHIKDNTDIQRVADIFYKRLWLAGHGYIFVDKTGGMHHRTIIDNVVNSPEREIFLKADVTLDGLKQNMRMELFNNDQPCLDTSQIRDLDINDEGRYQQLVNNAKDKRAGLASAIRKLYVGKNASKLGLTESKLDNCIVNKVLYSDNIVKLTNGVEITVEEAYSNIDLYDGQYLHDPLEPDYGGSTGSSTKAWFDLYNSRVYSHAHGGIEYVLEHSARKSPLELALEVCDLKDHLMMFRMAANEAINMRYIDTEIDQLIDSLYKKAGMKKGSCERAFKAEYNRIKPTADKIGNIDLEVNSTALDENGEFLEDLIQRNISAPITSQFIHTFMRGDIRLNHDTFENFEFMTKGYGIKFLYDVILKSPEITFPIGVVSEGDDKMNASMSRLKSLCVLNGLGKDSVNYTVELVNSNQINPVLDWISSVEWDGNNRMDLIMDNIRIGSYGSSETDSINDEFSDNYKRKVLRMWFIQCIAALDGSKRSPLSHSIGIAVPKYEYILVFVGGQGVQKTKFIKSLLPNELNNYILTGHELDTKDKDSVKIAISHWITELGELDSTFKKSDISSLKAFMSKEDDEIRMPYAAKESKFVRRTSFCGTVNDIQFLVDKTGNRRMLPMEVLSVNPLFDISVPLTQEEKDNGKVPLKMSNENENKQFWAEILHYYLKGEQWWPDLELEKMLDVVVSGHERVDPVVEAIEEKFDLVKNDEWRKKYSVRGEYGVDSLGQSHKFAILNVRQICDEVGISTTDPRISGLAGNYIRSKGISLKAYRVDGNVRKAFKICLKRGQNLKNSFNMPEK